jgi:hypothetical protein
MENIEQMIIDNLSKELANRFDEIFREGLRLKGYVFKNKNEFESFVKENCTCEDFEDKQERIFYVKGNPFMIHNYKQDPFKFNQEENKMSISCNYGSYGYI